MRNILSSIVLAVILLTPTISAQWVSEGVWPDSSYKGGMHGIAVDKDGKVWTASYFKDTPLVNGNDTTWTAGIYIFNEDGTEAAFSPITTVATGGGFVVDTLNGNCRGMGVDENGNIIYVQSGSSKMFKINYQTGEGIARADITETGSSPTAPSVSADGTIYVGPVVGGGTNQIATYDTDLNYLGAAVVGPPSISRTLEVTSDGLTLYWMPFVAAKTYVYTRADEFSAFNLTDSIHIGMSIESSTWHPVTGKLWVSNDTRFSATYENLTWYEYDTMADTLGASFSWLNPIEGNYCRGIDFSPDGTIAYVGLFDFKTERIQKAVLNDASPVAIWETNITIADAGGTRSSEIVTIGQAATATDGLDIDLDEIELPPLPPSGTFDARFIFPSGNIASLKDFRADGNSSITWLLSFQAGVGGYPIKIVWDKNNLPRGAFRLKDNFGGIIYNVDMKSVDTLLVTNASINSLVIEYSLTPVEVTFICDMSYEIESGRFDPATFVPIVQGSFNGWQNSDPMTSVPGEPFKFEYIAIINSAEGDNFEYKFTYRIPDIGTIWESGANREHIFTNDNISSQAVTLERIFNDLTTENSTQRTSAVKFTVNTNSALSFPTNTPFSSIDNVVLSGAVLPLIWPSNGYPDEDFNKLIQLFDNGTNGDEFADDGIWSRDVSFPIYTPLNFQYKYSINYGLPNNNGTNDNESDNGDDHFILIPQNLVSATIKDDFGNTGYHDISDIIVAQEGDWFSAINVSDNSGGVNSQILLFGQSNLGSDGIDNLLGEIELPPTPPVGVFDARFKLPGGEESVKDYRVNSETESRWQINIQVGEAGYPISLIWDSNLLPDGSLILKILGSTIQEIDMKAINNYSVIDMSVQNIEIIYSEKVTSSFIVDERWNLLSIPLIADDMAKTTLFPNAISSAFAFNRGYQAIDTLTNGVGYWLKFSQQDTVTIEGQKVSKDTLEVKGGWNIIGPFDEAIDIASLTSIPENIVLSSYFGFNRGYYATDSLRASKGYWVKVTEDGKLFKNLVAPKKQILPAIEVKDDWGKIIIADNNGASRILYLTDGAINLNNFELPPLPPNNIFDVRFETNRYVEDIKQSQILKISSDNYPIEVSVSGVSLKFEDISGESKNILDGNKITLTNSNKKLFKIIPISIPLTYSLGQNYPNPFNPSTIIRFSIPENTQVKLSVFNVLGEKVADIVNSKMEAGNHEVEFDASNLGSGVYLYSLVTSEYRKVRKMMLIK